MTSILIVEDDKTIAMGIEYALNREGFATRISYDMESAQEALHNENFSLVILDVSLPDGNGFELCRRIKAEGDLPVIFLTVYDDEINTVMGLDLGADDYITKPFRVRELISRINSVLRRYDKPGHRAEIIIGELRINPTEAKVYKDNLPIYLTALEYRLLLTFAYNKGRILTRRQILENIWDVAGDFVNDNTLTVYVKRLRKKIEDNPRQPQIIKTVRGLGYKAGD
ncbi:MAG: response regulator transcription factor [Firmicutes bacterium]|nr:response regulator transcription factor [Bacillota bacterium]